MARQEITTDALRERLTSLLADWGAEMSMLLRELDEARKHIADLGSRSESHDQQIGTLEERLQDQAGLIDTLKAEAGAGGEMRAEIRAKDVEIERLASELESKQDLIRALRRDADAAERLKSDAKGKDQELAALQKERRQAEKRVTQLTADLEALRESSESDGSEGRAELEAVRAELDARKTLIKSLRADADRVAALESRLEEKRDIIATLEASVNTHADTIAALKRASEAWKQKYRALRGRDAEVSSAELPELSDTDIAALEQLDNTDIATPEHTIAIDMRRPLSEARRKAAQHQK